MTQSKVTTCVLGGFALCVFAIVGLSIGGCGGESPVTDGKANIKATNEDCHCAKKMSNCCASQVKSADRDKTYPCCGCGAGCTCGDNCQCAETGKKCNDRCHCPSVRVPHR